jgi:hypothetical protein
MDPAIVFTTGMATVKNPHYFCGLKTTRSCPLRNKNLENTFGKWYDFSRTAGSVLRLCMLEASGMKTYYDPDFSTKLQNLGYSQEVHVSPTVPPSLVPVPPSLVPACIDMAHGNPRLARRLAAEFDRLFPHCIIECDLQNIIPDMCVPISGHMYVIYFDEWIFYHIDAKMDVTLRGWTLDKKMIIHADVRVAVEKHSFYEPEDEVLFSINENGFTKFTSVKETVDLIYKRIPSQNSNVAMPKLL